MSDLVNVARVDQPDVRSADPQVTEILGHRLAELVEDEHPTLIIANHEVLPAVLGHVAARTLGLPLVTIAVDEGVLWFSEDIRDYGGQAAIVTDEPESYPTLEMTISAIRHGGGVVVGIAGVFPSQRRDVDGVPFRTLTS